MSKGFKGADRAVIFFIIQSILLSGMFNKIFDGETVISLAVALPLEVTYNKSNPSSYS